MPAELGSKNVITLEENGTFAKDIVEGKAAEQQAAEPLSPAEEEGEEDRHNFALAKDGAKV